MEQLLDLCRLDAIASNEFAIREYLKKNLTHLSDEVLFDGLGSIIFRKKGNGPKVLFMAHMDEVGFIVKGITAAGRLHVVKLGGVLDEASSHQMMRITTSSGKIIRGLLTMVPKEKETIYLIDLGVDTQEEVENLGIDIGDMVCFDSEPQVLPNQRVFSKALDDRIGCYALMRVIQNLQESILPCDAYFAFTSSEEVGTRGGKTVTSLIEPDITFAIDVASEKKSIATELNTRKLGEGLMLVHYDKTMVPRKSLLTFLKKIATENNIKYQKDMLGGGGTDAGSSHLVGAGRLAAVIGIPLRECHGPYSLCDMNDTNNVIKMVEAICQSIDEQTIEKLQEG